MGGFIQQTSRDGCASVAAAALLQLHSFVNKHIRSCQTPLLVEHHVGMAIAIQEVEGIHNPFLLVHKTLLASKIMCGTLQ